MRKTTAEKIKTQVRIRLPNASVQDLESLAKALHMDTADLTKFVMGSLSRCRPENFHKAIAAMVEAGTSQECVE